MTDLSLYISYNLPNLTHFRILRPLLENWLAHPSNKRHFYNMQITLQSASSSYSNGFSSSYYELVTRLQKARISVVLPASFSELSSTYFPLRYSNPSKYAEQPEAFVPDYSTVVADESDLSSIPFCCIPNTVRLEISQNSIVPLPGNYLEVSDAALCFSLSGYGKVCFLHSPLLFYFLPLSRLYICHI